MSPQCGHDSIILLDHEVVHHGSAALRSDYYCSDYYSEVYPGQIYDWARRNVPASAEAVFIGGKGFRAIGAIEALEEDLGRQILSANQAAFWHALRLSGVRTPVSRYAQLFMKVPQEV
jgi:maleate isomerase